MKKKIDTLNKDLDALALKAVMLDSGDIPALGEVLNALSAIETGIAKLKSDDLTAMVTAMKAYVEKVIMGECGDLTPLEAGVSKLQELCMRLAKGKELNADISNELALLGSKAASPAAEAAAGAQQPAEEEEGGEGGAVEAISREDMEIISDFVAESLENLATIEVALLELEQDTTDLDIINTIFRPFHTVKGVSGFLNFQKINRLSHAAENLLDRARNQELSVDEHVIDVILSSLDMLRKMIGNVQQSLNSGNPLEGDLDVDALIDRITELNAPQDQKERRQLGEILIENKVLKADDLQLSLERQKTMPDRKIGEILIADQKVEAGDVLTAIREQKRFNQPVALQIKIDTDKLDNVVDMVGELAIAQSMLRQNDLIKSSHDRKLDQIINQLNLITTGLQKTAMSLRMVPIKQTFQKMFRLVRDLAKKANKEVQLVMSGEDTEIDRNMVEEIYEPMVHMIRNSVDHGLETPEEREAADKPRQGTIQLKAYHKGGDIVIEINDDGRGLNREKIMRKAITKGLVKDGEKLTDSEINNFIFHPGFSTADKVTDISGRGVGMDVVKGKIVERLRGRIEVNSAENAGTTVLLRLPLTLAIIDGIIIKVQDEKFIIPTLRVQEFFKPKKEECHTVYGEGEMIKVRDTLLPLVRLNRFLGMTGNRRAQEFKDVENWKGLVVVVENQEKRMCLAVDELVGQEEVVIKNLGDMFKDVKEIAGGAIVGDGKISLILDVAEIIDATAGQEAA